MAESRHQLLTSPPLLGVALWLRTCSGASLSEFLDVERCNNPHRVARVADGPGRHVFPRVALVPAYAQQRGSHVHRTCLSSVVEQVAAEGSGDQELSFGVWWMALFSGWPSEVPRGLLAYIAKASRRGAVPAAGFLPDQLAF